MNLTIQQVSKKYKNKVALRDINVQFTSGIIGLLGPNGAGKSTLMRIIATLDQPSSGQIRWNGTDIAKKPKKLREELGFLPQDFGVYPGLNAIEFLEYMASIKGVPMKIARKRINELIVALNLTENCKYPIGGYSGGMKQRVGIAQALLNDPKLLIVDEPTVGLDPEERIRFRQLLSTLAHDRLIILSTHIVSDIESIATQIALLHQGQLLAYMQPEKLIQNIEGKVWKCIVTSDQFNRIQKQYLVSQAVYRSEGMEIRVISDQPPCSEAKKVAATL
jgi:ABC-type multidrug transport system ATPase subunit